MYPVNQVILGGDSMLNSLDDIDTQIQKMEIYRKKLQQLKTAQSVVKTPIWNEIDSELLPMTDEQKGRLFKDMEYVNTYNRIQTIVQTEILNLVKEKIENSTEGKELLKAQLSIVKKLKSKIIEDTNKEMELFNKFKEYSKINPEATYDEFIKNNM